MLHRVRAIIIKNNKLLVIKRLKSDLIYFVFPGGGVEPDEDLESAIRRECKEELGVDVKIIKKFISERFDRDKIKQLEHFYFCDIISGKIGTGSGPEYDVNSDYEGIHEIEWLDIERLLDHDIRPRNVAIKLLNILKNDKKFKNK